MKIFDIVFRQHVRNIIIFVFNFSLRLPFVSVGLCITRFLMFTFFALCFHHGVHLRSIRSNRSIQIQIPPLMLLFVVCRKDGEFTKPANEIRHSNVEFFEWICICLNRIEIQAENKQTKNTLTISGQIVL